MWSPDGRCPVLQVPGAGTRVRGRALRLPGEERTLDPQRGPEVLQTDHLGAGLLPQSLDMVRPPPLRRQGTNTGRSLGLLDLQRL